MAGCENSDSPGDRNNAIAAWIHRLSKHIGGRSRFILPIGFCHIAPSCIPIECRMQEAHGERLTIFQ